VASRKVFSVTTRHKGIQMHVLLEQFERLSQGLQRPGIDASKRSADRAALLITLCLNDWPWDEAERFTNAMFPGMEISDVV
jgi:hypothetical protein